MAIQNGDATIDGIRSFNFDSLIQLERLAIVGRYSHHELMVARFEAMHGNGAREPTVIGVRILTATLANIRPQRAVIDAAARVAIDQRFDGANPGRRHDPARDNRNFARNEKRTANGKIDTTDHASCFKRVIIDFERSRKFRMVDLDAPRFNHGGGKVRYTGQARIAPGAFQSDMNKAARDHGDNVAKAIPSKRIGAPEDMAGIAVYLASRAGAFTTGQNFVIDGGATIGS